MELVAPRLPHTVLEVVVVEHVDCRREPRLEDDVVDEDPEAVVRIRSLDDLGLCELGQLEE